MARMPSFLKPPKKIAKRQLELRAKLWPTLNEGDLWSRHTHDGFSTIPSTMALIMAIMDDLSKNKPVSSTYLELWNRSFDEGFATLSKAREIAFHSGFWSERAERTWKERLKILHELEFINLQSGASGPASYALILNPYKVIQKHHERKTPGMREDRYNALVARAIELGDISLSPPPPPAAPVAATAPAAPFPMPAGWTLPPAPAPAPTPAAAAPAAPVPTLHAGVPASEPSKA
ncbi:MULTISPECIES: hypothetical protein [unclassified Bradyrhizobium]|uniref:hypothetical protein n=1 Tax=unclassified Bradyrhizobium TaxID=2631580 RepID=UPI001FF92964|nr:MULTISPECIES: hypothetical protein [unclassified Bradyrhizobium]MCK1508463.1 hypothetical protein [Bradyrhizobium sp. 18]MCK1633564.1 hypothetical protein [Bradyrhizobium sp. 162]